MSATVAPLSASEELLSVLGGGLVSAFAEGGEEAGVGALVVLVEAVLFGFEEGVGSLSLPFFPFFLSSLSLRFFLLDLLPI